MATESKIKLFLERVQQFEALDKSRFYHTDLGNSSLEYELKDKFDSMINMLKIEIYQLFDFPDNDLQQIINSLQGITDFIGKVGTRNKSDFLGDRENILLSISSQIDAIMMHKPAFKIAKIDDILLDDVQTIRKEYKDVKAKIESDLKGVRESATGQSIEQAQLDFAEGAELNIKQAWLWGKISIFFIVAFIGFAIFLMFTGPGEIAGLEIAYYTAVRITLFFALATIIAFSLKILRANLLLRERNMHKGRLVNNLKSLIAAAPENQIELVLSILIQEISSFGNTGLLQKEDDSVSLVKNLVDIALKNKPTPS